MSNGGGGIGKECGDSGRCTTDESSDHLYLSLESFVFHKILDGKFDPNPKSVFFWAHTLLQLNYNFSKLGHPFFFMGLQCKMDSGYGATKPQP